MTAPHSKTILADLWRAAGQPGDALGAVELTGAEPVFPSSFAVGTLAQTTIAAAALAAAELWRLRTGRRQRVSRRHARCGDRIPQRALSARQRQAARRNIMDPIHGIYRCRDGRWVRIHANFPHHRDGVLAPARLRARSAPRWRRRWRNGTPRRSRAAAAEAGLVATMSRSFAEWDAHPQGRVVRRPAAVHHRADRRCAAASPCRPATARSPASGCSISRA